MTRRNSGFTLVEILVATAIFAVIMIAALMMYDKNQQVFKQSVEAADMQQNARVAFDKMVADVRMAGFDFNRDGEPQLAGQVE
jgi:type II secretion system protein J